MLSKNIIEKEYTFKIPKSKLKTKLPTVLKNFILKGHIEYKIKDILLERLGAPLSDVNIGMRIRIKDNGVIELTYKKFLGRKNGLAHYDERTLLLTNKDLAFFYKNGVFPAKEKWLLELQKEGRLYVLLEINNSREFFKYSYKKDVIEVVVEDITYSNDSKSAKDYMLEVELFLTSDIEIIDVVNLISVLFNAKEVNEGKITRALKMLS